MNSTFLSYKQLKAIRKEISRLSNQVEILDPTNSFERKELSIVLKQLRYIHNTLTNRDTPEIASNRPQLRLVK